MSHRESVLQNALELSQSDRVYVAHALLDSVDESNADMTEEEIQEILRRDEELKKNPEIGIPWEQIKADIQARRK